MKTYTEEEKKEILDYYRDGHTYKDVNDEYGVSPNTLSKWLGNNKKKKKVRDEKMDNVPILQNPRKHVDRDVLQVLVKLLKGKKFKNITIQTSYNLAVELMESWL